MGLLLVWDSRTSQGRDEMLTALRLNPRDPRNVRWESNIAISYYYEHDYENAVEAAKRVVRRYAHHPHPYYWLAAALGQLGRTGEARDTMRQAIAVSPAAIAAYLRSRPRWFRPEQHEHLLDGLRKARWDG
jgi:adenylate cyclase